MKYEVDCCQTEPNKFEIAFSRPRIKEQKEVQIIEYRIWVNEVNMVKK